MPATIQQQRPESKGVGDFFDILFKGAQLGTAFAQLGQQKQKLEEDKRQFDIGKKLESINLTLETVGGDDPVERKKAFETMKPMLIEMMSLGKGSNETKVKGMMDELEKNANMSYGDRLLTIAKESLDFDFDHYEQLKEQQENPPVQEQPPMEAGPPLSAVMPSGDVGAGYIQKNNQYLANIDKIRASGASERAKGVAITNELSKMQPLPPATYAAKVEAFTAKMRNNPELLRKRLAIIGGSDPTRPEYTQEQLDKGMQDLTDMLMNNQTRSARISAEVQAKLGLERINALSDRLDATIAGNNLEWAKFGLDKDKFDFEKDVKAKTAAQQDLKITIDAALADNTMKDSLNMEIKTSSEAYAKVLRDSGFKAITNEEEWVKALRYPAVKAAYRRMVMALAAKMQVEPAVVEATIKGYEAPLIGWLGGPLGWKVETQEYPILPGTEPYPGAVAPEPTPIKPQTEGQPQTAPAKKPLSILEQRRQKQGNMSQEESDFKAKQDAIESQIF